MRALASYIMRGRISALTVAFVASALMWLAPPFTTVLGELALGAVIGLVTLRNGVREGGLIVLGAGLVTAAFALLVIEQGAFAFVMTGAVVLPAIPVWILAYILRRTVSWGLTLTAAAAIGALIVLATYVATQDPTVFWQARLATVVEALRDALTVAANQGQITVAEVEQAVSVLGSGSAALAPWMTGLFAVSMLTVFISSLMLARWWQALLYNPGGWRGEFYTLRLPKMLAIVTGGCVVAAVVLPGMLGQVAADLVFVACSVYLFPGLAIVHGWMQGRPYAGPVLAGMYVLLLVIPQFAVLLAGAGWLDAWVNVRRRA